MKVLSIGDEVVPGRYRLHSRFQKAVNFNDGERLVALVTLEIGAGPLNLVLDRLPADPPPSLDISDDGTIWLGHRALDLDAARRYDSSLPGRGELAGLRTNLPVLEARLKLKSPPESIAFLLEESRLQAFTGFAAAFACHAAAAVEQILTGDLTAGVTALKGCGPGLTPSGDDFLAGLLLALNVRLEQCPAPERAGLRGAIQSVHRAALGGNLLSNAFLGLAERGRVASRTKALIRALGAGDAASVEAAADASLLLGATSGADLGVGLYLGLARAPRFAPSGFAADEPTKISRYRVEK